LRRYRPYLRVLCETRLPELCKRREDASDIVQQTLLDATCGLPAFRGTTVAEFESWMLRLLERNLLQSMRWHLSAKRDVRREEHSLAVNGSGVLRWHTHSGGLPTPQSMLLQGEVAILLCEALEKLPERQRMAVELRYLAGESLEQIARAMETTKGATAGLIRRGVEQLRRQLPMLSREFA
jgi:RNA polymerase sigma-70 factor (ECF subfamily)